MRQQGALFSPFVLPVKVGDTVSFPNFDDFRHQVYSFSKTKRFEIRLFSRDESKSVTFDKPGVVALGCNIHDNMLAYIYVSSHPFVAKSEANGRAFATGLAEGDYDVHVWHPDMSGRSATDATSQVSVGVAGAELTIDLQLRAIRSKQLPPDEDEY